MKVSSIARWLTACISPQFEDSLHRLIVYQTFSFSLRHLVESRHPLTTYSQRPRLRLYFPPFSSNQLLELVEKDVATISVCFIADTFRRRSRRMGSAARFQTAAARARTSGALAACCGASPPWGPVSGPSHCSTATETNHNFQRFNANNSFGRNKTNINLLKISVSPASGAVLGPSHCSSERTGVDDRGSAKRRYKIKRYWMQALRTLGNERPQLGPAFRPFVLREAGGK